MQPIISTKRIVLITDCASMYAHDQTWKNLQQSGKWFALKPLIGKQKASYSDIEKKTSTITLGDGPFNN